MASVDAPRREDDLRRIRQALAEADLVLVGASNGIDMAEGLNVFRPDAHFMQAYGDLAQASGARSILEGLFMSRGDLARLWAWAARFACVEWLDYRPGIIMEALRGLIGGRDHFILTCNMDARFARAGFDAARILETEGSMAEAVCSRGCCDERHPVGESVRELDASIEDGRVDVSLIPTCPHCGAPLVPATDERRLAHPDAAAQERIRELNRLLAAHRGRNLVVLELGVGLRNGTIKQVLAQASAGEPHLMYAVFNYNQVVFPRGLEHACIGIDGDMSAAFARLR